MGREVLFRGKRRYTEEWAESVCPLGVMHAGHLCDDFIPETVGQYTGLMDKNGKKIFEGDILLLDDINGVVNYGTGCFCVQLRAPNYMFRNNPAIDIVLNEYPGLEIVGNIHDNQELLKEGSK